MKVQGIIKKGEYFDSVTLMLVARSLTEIEGVSDATVVMGTQENKDILQNSDMLKPEFEATQDTDLIIAVKAEDDKVIEETLVRAEELLIESKNKKSIAGEYQPKSLEGGVNVLPGANMVMISIAGRYAGDEAMKALKQGLHVMLFSDNIPVEKEIELKKIGREKGLLVMGPDCGTAIINGAPLCFSNVCNRGDIGVVGASGTGTQEVTVIISNEGAGISQAIGTGGRDVKKDVGGIMFLEGIKALAKDDDTKIITLVSKPPSEEVLKKVVDVVKDIDKPVVAILIGGDPAVLKEAGIIPATTLEEAALISVALSKGESLEDCKKILADREEQIIKQAAEEASKIKDNQKYLRGLFSGGTFKDEAQLIFKEVVGIHTYGNAPIDSSFQLENVAKSKEHTILDLGDDEFTVGRPHPMIDYLLRNKRIIEEAKDPETAVILLDVVLGYGSNMTPGDEFAPVFKEVKQITDKEGRYVPIVCSITGTEKDPQDTEKVRKQLEEAGAIILPSNAAACKMAIKIIENLGK